MSSLSGVSSPSCPFSAQSPYVKSSSERLASRRLPSIREGALLPADVSADVSALYRAPVTPPPPLAAPTPAANPSARLGKSLYASFRDYLPAAPPWLTSSRRTKSLSHLEPLLFHGGLVPPEVAASRQNRDRLYVLLDPAKLDALKQTAFQKPVAPTEPPYFRNKQGEIDFYSKEAALKQADRVYQAYQRQKLKNRLLSLLACGLKGKF